MRRGFTLVEVLVALVIFEFGILAVMASSAIAARQLGAANRRLRAQWLASDRVEMLRATACRAPAVGSARGPNGVREFWRVEAIGARRVITDSVSFVGAPGKDDYVVGRGWVLCPD